MASTQGRGRTASLEHTISASVRLGQASVTEARQLGQCGGMTTAPRSRTAALPELPGHARAAMAGRRDPRARRSLIIYRHSRPRQ